ncbi:MAG: TetR/AcrR family transcriptional regulator [Bacteriovoracaceae bacterium]|jgi:AcrR family transcriptional regulator
MKVKAKKSLKKRHPGRPSGDGNSITVHKAVIKILAREGYEGLSIETVAFEAKINKTSVYRKWKTKEELVESSLINVAEKLQEKVIVDKQRVDLNKMALEIATFLSSSEGRALFMASIQSSSTRVSTAARKIINHQDSPQKLELSLIAGAIIHRIFIENELTDSKWINAMVSRLQ